MGINDFFIALTLNCMLLFVWFNTTAFYDYLKLFGANKFFKEYEKTPPTVTYPQFLYQNKETLSDNRIIKFLIKLITCVFCLNFWTTLCICTYYNAHSYIPLVYICTLLIHGTLKRLYDI
jgi:hypothetical protein